MKKSPYFNFVKNEMQTMQTIQTIQNLNSTCIAHKKAFEIAVQKWIEHNKQLKINEELLKQQEQELKHEDNNILIN